MSTLSIRTALETALGTVSPAISIAYENQSFIKPVTAYQQAHILFARPDNVVFGAEHIERGYMQVKLMYPANAGSSAAYTQAEAIRTTFQRGTTFSSGGVNVIVSDTPEVSPGMIEEGRYAVIVKIRFFSHIN